MNSLGLNERAHDIGSEKKWLGVNRGNCRGGIGGQYDQSRLYAFIKFSKIKINKNPASQTFLILGPQTNIIFALVCFFINDECGRQISLSLVQSSVQNTGDMLQKLVPHTLTVRDE